MEPPPADDAATRTPQDDAPPEEDPGVTWTHAFLPLKLGEGATGPLVPLYAAQLGAGALFIGAMETLFSGLSMFGAFVWGRTSDEVAKRKPFILAGFVGAVIALAGLALAESRWSMLAWRALQGFVMAAYVAVGGALIADRARPHNVGRRMGYLNAVGGLGYSVGLVGGALLLLRTDPRSIFALAALVTLASVVLAFVLVREPHAHLRRREVHRLFRNVTIPFSMPVQRRTFSPTVFLHRPKLNAVERRAWTYLAAIGLTFLATGATFSLLPLYLDRLGASATQVLLLFLVIAVSSTLAFSPSGVLADRFGYRRVQVGGLGARAVMFLALAVPFARDLVAISALFIVGGVTWAVVNTTGPAALFRGMEIRKRGELVGLFNLMAGLGMMLGALAAGIVVALSDFRTLFLLSGMATALATLLVALVVYPPRADATRA